MNPRPSDPGLMHRMTVTVEPGCYIEGEFGIRIENVTIIENAAGLPGFLRIRPICWAPIQRKLIDTELLSADQITWLDNYHAQVLAELGPLLGDDDRAWLSKQVAPLAPAGSKRKQPEPAE
mmetsp:Transcript_51478/g.120794  ORF Transcript_51478/g.120794 Transcript_51478/m.120794 type:complete len:121 (+) Transcript_51478:259-621(+)